MDGHSFSNATLFVSTCQWTQKWHCWLLAPRVEELQCLYTSSKVNCLYYSVCAGAQGVKQLFCMSVGTKSPLWKPRHLSNSLASLFSQSPQKLPLVLFKLFGIAHEHHEQHPLLSHCCHSHIILFKAQISLHSIVENWLRHSILDRVTVFRVYGNCILLDIYVYVIVTCGSRAMISLAVSML